MGREQAQEAVLAGMELVEQEAREAWPGLSVPPDEFAAYVAARLPAGRTLEEVRGELRAGDLYLACACARGEPRALRAFDAAYRLDIERAFARVRPAGMGPDDAFQILRQKLFVGGAERPPRILDYAGRGALRAWTRMTAIRTFIDLARERSEQRREVALEEVLFTAAMPPERVAPDMALLRSQYRAEFRAAFEESVASLTPRQRNILRQHLIHGLSIDRLGALYRVHRSTCARWLEAARDALVLTTRRSLAARLGVDAAELDEVMHLVASQLDITFQRVLSTRPGD